MSIEDEIEDFASSITCPRHVKNMRACLYNGKPCTCRQYIEICEHIRKEVAIAMDINPEMVGVN